MPCPNTARSDRPVETVTASYAIRESTRASERRQVDRYKESPGQAVAQPSW